MFFLFPPPLSSGPARSHLLPRAERPRQPPPDGRRRAGAGPRPRAGGGALPRVVREAGAAGGRDWKENVLLYSSFFCTAFLFSSSLLRNGRVAKIVPEI